jgi:hypothetical protein
MAHALSLGRRLSSKPHHVLQLAAPSWRMTLSAACSRQQLALPGAARVQMARDVCRAVLRGEAVVQQPMSQEATDRPQPSR